MVDFYYISIFFRITSEYSINISLDNILSKTTIFHTLKPPIEPLINIPLQDILKNIYEYTYEYIIHLNIYPKCIFKPYSRGLFDYPDIRYSIFF